LAFNQTQKAVIEASASRKGRSLRSAMVLSAGLHRRILGDQVEGDEGVRAHAQLDRAGGQQLGHVHARAALDDLDVEAALLIGPGGERLVEAPVFGLGAPVGGEPDADTALVVDGRLGPEAGCEARQGRDDGRDRPARKDDTAAGDWAILVPRHGAQARARTRLRKGERRR
jgi:hypothetical protein